MMNLPVVDIRDIPLSPPTITEEELATYLSEKRILIVDTSSYVTQTLQRIVVQFGANVSETYVYRSYETAAQGILARRPHILITALHLDNEFGLELVKLQEQQFSSRLDFANLVLVPDTSSSSAGIIAEANVDAALMLPLNLQSAKDAFFQALSNKIKPSPYWMALEKGKEHFNRVELEEAMRLFEEAKRFDPKPTLSFYYQGLIQHRKQEFERALDSFYGGLYYDPQDYRCLNASFDLQFERSEYQEAYALAKRIHEVYPVNARRLLDLVKLSIMVGKFDDIPTYYQVFMNQKNPDLKITRGMIAALLVTAKSLTMRRYQEKALNLLRSASYLSAKHKVLREDTLRYYVETKHYEQALEYYADLPATLKEDEQVQLLSLEAYHGIGDSKDTIRFGTQILKNGKAPARAYEIMLEHSRRIGRPPTVIARIVTEAYSNYPTMKW